MRIGIKQDKGAKSTCKRDRQRDTCSAYSESQSIAQKQMVQCPFFLKLKLGVL